MVKHVKKPLLQPLKITSGLSNTLNRMDRDITDLERARILVNKSVVRIDTTKRQKNTPPNIPIITNNDNAVDIIYFATAAEPSSLPHTTNTMTSIKGSTEGNIIPLLPGSLFIFVMAINAEQGTVSGMDLVEVLPWQTVGDISFIMYAKDFEANEAFDELTFDDFGSEITSFSYYMFYVPNRSYVDCTITPQSDTSITEIEWLIDVNDDQLNIAIMAGVINSNDYFTPKEGYTRIGQNYTPPDGYQLYGGGGEGPRITIFAENSIGIDNPSATAGTEMDLVVGVTISFD